MSFVIRRPTQFPILDPRLTDNDLHGEEKRQEIVERVMREGTCQNVTEIPQEVRDIFVVSADITAEEHVRMQAALQAFVDNSLSKTVNFPEGANEPLRCSEGQDIAYAAGRLFVLFAIVSLIAVACSPAAPAPTSAPASSSASSAASSASSSAAAGTPKSVTVAVHPVDTAPQDVTATATSPNASSDSAFVTSTITGVGLTEMAVTMSSTNPGKVGEQLVYTVTVTNIQDDDARNVFAILALPKGTTFVSATKGCTHGILVSCKLGQMSPGTSKAVTITVLPTISGWTQATAGVRLTTPDRDFTNNSAANSIWINP